MSLAPAQRLRTEAEYLEHESRADFKSEYVAGNVFAMAGASERHNRIAGNIFFHLRAPHAARHAVPFSPTCGCASTSAPAITIPT